ncbi:AMP dependent ligase/synthetase [Aspergillus arachidicola]|uniref:AMP dependent ligase/synthetase n=1 Tax=Aspergillus arachidicola TaxID=656916 RepID=A0A2G7FRW2_9EURO|nr:AMP dependent ligase/synthetase [Aspergillus arachidicola]
MASTSSTAQSLLKKHPLQRIHSPSRGFSALVHLLGLSSFVCMHENPNHANEAYGWHFQYLTVIGLSLSTLTFAIGLLADVTLSARLFLIKNLLSICSAPLEVLISILYWGLRVIDERLVVPDWAVIPLNADISFHAIPSIVLLIDLFLLSPPWTISILPALGLSSTIAFGFPLSLTTETTVLHAEAADPTNNITKAQARTITKRLAHVFRTDFGIGNNGAGKDAVLCISSNQVLLPAVFFAIIAAGGVYTAASTAFTQSELSRQIQQSKSQLIIASLDNKAKALKAALACGIPVERVLILESSTHKHLLRDTVDPERNYLQNTKELDWERVTDRNELETRLICLLFSSGTTGPPKGVMLSHMNLVSEAIIPQLVLRESRKGKPHLEVPYRTIGHLPTAHIAGCQGYFITPAVAGGTVYWMPKFNIDQFMDYCKKYQVTFLATAPPVYLAVAESPRVTDQFNSLIRAESGAAPLPTEVQRRAEEKLGCSISQRWGMTESTGSVTTMPWGQADSTGSISPLLPNTRLRIVDEQDRDVEQGMEGEILVKGPMVTKGYFENQDATAAAFAPNGWFRTGDIGVWKDGKIYMVDRKKELIKYKGLQVSPVEVEACLLSHDCVADAAVIGVPDPSAPGNELPRAYIVLENDRIISEEELKSHVKSNMASHKQLRGGVVFTKEIPKSSSGKILRRLLRDQARKSTEPRAKL